MKQLVVANNALQTQLLQRLNDTIVNTGRTVSIYDAYSVFEEILLNPPTSAFGPNPNVTSFCNACPTADPCEPCEDPQSYFYADRK